MRVSCQLTTRDTPTRSRACALSWLRRLRTRLFLNPRALRRRRCSARSHFPASIARRPPAVPPGRYTLGRPAFAVAHHRFRSHDPRTHAPTYAPARPSPAYTIYSVFNARRCVPYISWFIWAPRGYFMVHVASSAAGWEDSPWEKCLSFARVLYYIPIIPVHWSASYTRSSLIEPPASAHLASRYCDSHPRAIVGSPPQQHTPRGAAST